MKQFAGSSYRAGFGKMENGFINSTVQLSLGGMVKSLSISNIKN
jgi:hypothetical protein